MTVVPIIDLRSPDAADELDRAATEVGFFQVVGHGVPDSVIADALAAMDEFFSLPLDVKRRYPPPSPDVNNGYSAIGDESLAYSLGVEAPPDLFEAFNIGPEDMDLDDPVVAAEAHRIFAPNIWPTEAPTLRRAGMAYFEATRDVAHQVTRVCARALGLDDAFFEAFTTHSTDTLRMNWFQRDPGAPEPLPGQQRIGAHTDYGIVTVLYGDSVPGLEVLTQADEWLPIIPEPGAYVVNVGDLLAQWTNDRWRSTLHRVTPPPPGVDGPAKRRSIAFFHDGNYDALITCLSTCCSDENPPRYEPVLAGEHLMNKLVGGRTMTAADETAHIGGRLGAVTS